MNPSLQYRLLNQFDQIDFLLEDLPDDFITKRFRPNKWSIHENLAHLGRYHEVFRQRIDTILKQNNPTFTRYKAEDDSHFQYWIKRKSFNIIDQTKSIRRTITAQLRQLDFAEIKRTGLHPKLGEMNIEEWTEFFLLHESHHFYTIFGIVQKNKLQ